ncbi:ribonuclease HII [Luteolibacter pohnpeiensis]|uniref:Ribonuclease HII n=1 Tax=Luteolibacter pohnpeiensis TaxID=454153 RepID=A0A934SDM1_9BACT|nr:ribonuclease HII [Luteolibacter pohnpeiensis]MBK1883293.1 ribonuclease HII [Luteolibacter pohnpeiensis]
MPDFSFENALRQQGISLIAGIDEAGRGPLAGPVSAAAVILPSDTQIPALDDSKKLSAKKREQLYDILTQDPEVIWAVAFAEVEEIESLNILRASHLAMERAVSRLRQHPQRCLIDGLRVKNFPWPHDAIVKGDSRSLSIAAASVIAKVSRDRVMKTLHEEFPQYGFAKHQGYGTREHLEALRTHGPCRHHRRSFQPVAQLQLPLG